MVNNERLSKKVKMLERLFAEATGLSPTVAVDELTDDGLRVRLNDLSNLLAQASPDVLRIMLMDSYNASSATVDLFRAWAADIKKVL